MAYNNYFPATYQPQYTYPNLPVSQPQTPLSPSNNGFIWVQGETGAKAYPVAAGNSVLLMDSEDKYFYIKTTDATGIPQPLRKFSYIEELETATPAPIDTSAFITREEFEKKIAELSEPKKEKKEGK